MDDEKSPDPDNDTPTMREVAKIVWRKFKHPILFGFGAIAGVVAYRAMVLEVSDDDDEVSSVTNVDSDE